MNSAFCVVCKKPTNVHSHGREGTEHEKCLVLYYLNALVTGEDWYGEPK